MRGPRPTRQSSHSLGSVEGPYDERIGKTGLLEGLLKKGLYTEFYWYALQWFEVSDDREQEFYEKDRIATNRIRLAVHDEESRKELYKRADEELAHWYLGVISRSPLVKAHPESAGPVAALLQR